MRHARQAIDAHLQTIGSKASTGAGKSHLFASAPGARRALRRTNAGDERAVLSHWRDLGAQASVSGQQVAPTMPMRLRAAQRVAATVEALPIGAERKIELARSKVIPAGIYGVEASYIADGALRALRGAIFRAAKARCNMGANAAHIFEEIAAKGQELDPEVVIARRRATAFARAWRGGGPLRATLRASWEAYAAVNHPATSADGLQEAQPIVPPGWAGRAGWRRDVPCQGPVYNPCSATA